MKKKTIRPITRFLAAVLAAGSLMVFTQHPAGAAATVTNVTINGSSLGRTFEGIGAISSNGMTKLLKEYPSQQQQDILDFLFKPKYGASLQHLKIEIGSDANGTCGTEPSHMRSATDFDITRGVGLWLAQQARIENPNILLDALRWGTPAWVTNDTQKFLYYKNFLQGARDTYGLEFNYLSADENEGDFSRDWVVNTLRPGLDSNGFSNVKITAADSTTDWNIASMVSSDTALKNALCSINMHYRQDSPDNAKTCGLPIWDSEDVAPYRNDFSFSLDMAYKIIHSYTSGKMVKYELHPVVEATYDDVPYTYKSILTAANPWSGHYDVEPGLWVVAQFTQFIQPGWVYLDSGCASGTDSGYITLKNPSTNDYSMIILNRGTSDNTYNVSLTGALSSGTLHVWGTDETSQFVRKSDIAPSGNSFQVTVPAGSIYSLTTTTGQQKGQATYSDPQQTAFNLPYTDDFESYDVGKQPKYTVDQGGAFEIAQDSGGKYLRQVITPDIKPVDWERRATPSPYTILGGEEWKNYQVSANVRLETSDGYVLLGGRENFSPTGNVPSESYNLRVFYDGSWELRKAALVLASGTLSSFNINQWYPMKLVFNDSNIQAYFNNSLIASVNDTEIPSGHIVLGSSYNYADFDNLSVTPVNSSTPTSCLRYEEVDNRVEYIGDWEDSGSNAKNYSRTLLTSKTADNYMEFAFNGTAVSVLGMIGTDCGRADVYVDNVYQTTVDTYSSPVKYRKSLFSAYGLQSGNHTLKLVVKGTKNASSTDNSIYVDAIEITGGTGLVPMQHPPIPSGTVQPVSLLSADFSTDTVGQAPAGWTIASDANTSCLAANAPGTTNICMKQADSNSSGAVSASRSIPAQTQNLTVQYRYCAETTGKWFRLYVQNGTTNAVEIYDSNANGLCYRNASAADVKIADISANTWYTVRLDIDIVNHVFNVYLNDNLMLSNCPFRNTVSQISGISLQSGGGFVGNAYFDDISVAVPDLVNQNFDSETVGASPKGWLTTAPSNTSCSIQAFPSSTDKSMRLTDSNTTDSISVSKPFAKQNAILVADYAFNDSAVGTWSRFLLKEGSTDAIEIYNSDQDGLCYRDGRGQDIKIMDIAANTWYNVRIVADARVDRFDIYVNNQLAAAGCGFRNVVGGINWASFASGESYTGTTYVSSVQIRKGSGT